MKGEYDSILAKARKLAAVADPASGASEGERENAANALTSLLNKHRITSEMLSEDQRTVRHLLCVSPFAKHKPGLDKMLIRLAAQSLRYITGHSNHHFDVYVTTLEAPTTRAKRPSAKKRKRPAKPIKAYVVTALATELEFIEWEGCFKHYAGDFLDSMVELRRQVRIAQQAVKLGLSAFLSKHEIYPADAEEGDGQSSPEALAAFMKAYSGAKGDKWQKKAGYLQEELLLR